MWRPSERARRTVSPCVVSARNPSGPSSRNTMFERIPLDQLLAQIVTDDIDHTSAKQLFLFE
jgi:hypothetical protein